MIASTTLSVVFLVILIAKTSRVDLVGVKKVLVKPLYGLPLVENQNAVPKITVSIYYASLCADCVDFFKRQIGPNSATFQKYVDFDFVPFGMSQQKLFEGKWFFKCRNGVNECMKNKWQACSIHVLPPKLHTTLASYLACYMSSTDEILSGYQCTRKYKGLYDEYYAKIKKCFMNREFSDSLMVHYSNRTQNVVPRLTRMPSVIFNGAYNETEQDDARKNLGNVICKYLIPKPTELC